MANLHHTAKVIAVYDKNGYTTQVLKKILAFCGRGNCRVAPAGEPTEPGVHPAVLLLCDAVKAADADRFPVCVAGYDIAARPELQGLRPVTFSAESDSADFTARNIRRTQDGFTAFEIVGVGVIGRVRLAGDSVPYVGAVLAAAAAAISCGIAFAEVLEALNHIEIEEE
ncbi:MAG TPA: hypothetical protein VHP54_01845 [Caproiciproducens sp.]|nr:hypothetical protein [Caproiciproducens sp.]